MIQFVNQSRLMNSVIFRYWKNLNGYLNLISDRKHNLKHVFKFFHSERVNSYRNFFVSSDPSCSAYASCSAGKDGSGKPDESGTPGNRFVNGVLNIERSLMNRFDAQYRMIQHLQRVHAMMNRIGYGNRQAQPGVLRN